jgi:hypothetical protein
MMTGGNTPPSDPYMPYSGTFVDGSSGSFCMREAVFWGWLNPVLADTVRNMIPVPGSQMAINYLAKLEGSEGDYDIDCSIEMGDNSKDNKYEFKKMSHEFQETGHYQLKLAVGKDTFISGDSESIDVAEKTVRWEQKKYWINMTERTCKSQSELATL